MSLILADRVKETTATTGTGSYALAGAAAGFQSFVAGIGSGNTVYYCATDGTNWEVGLGTVTDSSPDILSRDSILSSSNSDNPVDWGSGTKTVFCVIPAASVAGQAITDLGLMTAGQVANTDVIPVVDVSDTTQSAAGSTKGITRQNFLDPNNLAAYAAGTVYTLTASVAKVDFGTTDPGLTVNVAGTYRLQVRVVIKFNGATYAASQTITLKIRRTNNTAADVSNTTTVVTIPVMTTLTDGQEITLPPVFYTTTNANDALEVQAGLSALPSAGSVTVEECCLLAERIF